MRSTWSMGKMARVSSTLIFSSRGLAIYYRAVCPSGGIALVSTRVEVDGDGAQYRTRRRLHLGLKFDRVQHIYSADRFVRLEYERSCTLSAEYAIRPMTHSSFFIIVCFPSARELKTSTTGPAFTISGVCALLGILSGYSGHKKSSING
jgi:hypothetical protein